MSNAFINSFNGSALNTPLSAAVSAGDLLAVVLQWNLDTGTAALTDNLGNTYTAISQVHNTFDGVSLSVFQTKVTVAGTATITPTGTTATYSMMGASWSGLDLCALGAAAAGQYQSTGAIIGTDTLTSGNVTPGSQPGVLFGAGLDNPFSTSRVAAGTGFTDRTPTTPLVKMTQESLVITSTSAIAATFSPQTGDVSSPRGLAVGAFFADTVIAPTSYFMSSDTYF